MSNLLILSTEASRYFACFISQNLGMGCQTDIERRIFGGGEKYFRIGINERTDLLGKDVVFVGSTHTDEDLEELYRIGRALVEYGARRIIFVIPFLGYSTMDRASKAGEVVTAKTVACKLSLIPNGDLRNVFLMMDLHTPGLVHYFEGNCLRFELSAEDVLAGAVKDISLTDFVFGSADLGRPKGVKAFAKKFGSRIVLVDKDRDFEEISVNQIIGDVEDKTVVIYDDMTRSGHTIFAAANAYRKAGAKNILAVLNHFALNSEDVVTQFIGSLVSEVITTNTHPMSNSGLVKKYPRIFHILDVSHLFAGAIKSIID